MRALVVIARLLFDTATVAAMVPSLRIIYGHKRHFELFVGVFQVVSGVFYNLSVSFGNAPIFLRQDDWHMIADITAEAYICLLCVHLAGFRDEGRNALLRYVGFALCWIVKLRDGWDSVVYEVLVVSAFVATPIVTYARAYSGSRPPLPYRKKALLRGAQLGAAALTLLIVEQVWDTSFRFFLGMFHMAAGGAAYYCWQILPAMDRKKIDGLPLYSFH